MHIDKIIVKVAWEISHVARFYHSLLLLINCESATCEEHGLLLSKYPVSISCPGFESSKTGYCLMKRPQPLNSLPFLSLNPLEQEALDKTMEGESLIRQIFG